MTATPQPDAGPRLPDEAQQPRPRRTPTAAAALLSAAVVCLVLLLFVL
jgi:hypothetical protein